MKNEKTDVVVKGITFTVEHDGFYAVGPCGPYAESTIIAPDDDLLVVQWAYTYKHGIYYYIGDVNDVEIAFEFFDKHADCYHEETNAVLSRIEDMVDLSCRYDAGLYTGLRKGGKYLSSYYYIMGRSAYISKYGDHYIGAIKNGYRMEALTPMTNDQIFKLDEGLEGLRLDDVLYSERILRAVQGAAEFQYLCEED